MLVKVSLVAAFFLMVGAPIAGASEGARSTGSIPVSWAIAPDRASNIVVAQEAQSDDSADSDSDSDSNDSSDSDSDSQSADSEQNGDGDQTDQQSAAAPQAQAPDADAGEAGQLPLNSYPQQQANPN